MDITHTRQLLLRKMDLLADIKRLSEQQPELIELESPDPLLDSLAERQKLIDSIDALDKIIQLDEEATRDAEILRTTDEIHSLLGQIVKLDARNLELAETHRAELGGQLKSFSENKRRAGGYTRQEDAPALYFNKKK